MTPSCCKLITNSTLSDEKIIILYFENVVQIDRRSNRESLKKFKSQQMTLSTEKVCAA